MAPPSPVSRFVFGPRSIMWKICRERWTIITGPAAAVLQVAHPKVAAGVRDHSSFQYSPTARLERTLDAVHTIAFGTADEAAAMSKLVARKHARVRGYVEDPVSTSPIQSYTADDAELLMWVIATLVAAAVDGYELVVEHLPQREKEIFYREMRTFGRYFGLDPAYGPQSWNEFLHYYQHMLADPRIGSHPVSRTVAWQVACPQKPAWFRWCARPIRFVFSEILPPPVRDRLGFGPTPWSRLCITLARFLMPRIVPWLPPVMRYVPAYLRAERIIRQPSRRIQLATQRQHVR